MPTAQDQISRAFEICRQYFIRYLGLVLEAFINSVNCVCHMNVEDIRFHKKMILNYYFSSRHVRKNTRQFLVPLSIFCGFSCALLL